LERFPTAGSDDFDDIVWLRNRQQFLRAVLASRAAMHGQQVVDLTQWRGGGLLTAA